MNIFSRLLFILVCIVGSIFLVSAQEEIDWNRKTPDVSGTLSRSGETSDYDDEMQVLNNQYSQEIENLMRKYGITPSSIIMLNSLVTAPPHLKNNLTACNQYLEDLNLLDKFERGGINYDQLTTKTRAITERFGVTEYLSPIQSEEDLREYIPFRRATALVTKKFNRDFKTLQEKYQIDEPFTNNSEENIYGQFYKGLQIPDGEEKISSVDQLSYNQETSQSWHGIMRQIYEEPKYFSFIKKAVEWKKISKDFPNIQPAVVQLFPPLNPALVKVFSEPKKYLTPEWNVSMIRDIVIVPKTITQGAPFNIPSVQRMNQPLGKDEKIHKIQYRFYLPEGLEAEDMAVLMKKLQNGISRSEGKITPDQLIRRNQFLEDTLRRFKAGLEDFCAVTDIEKRADVDIDKLFTQLTEVDPGDYNSPVRAILDQLVDLGSPEVVERLEALLLKLPREPEQESGILNRMFKIEVFYALTRILTEKDREKIINLAQNEAIIGDTDLQESIYGALSDLYVSTPKTKERIGNIFLTSLNSPDLSRKRYAIRSILVTGDEQLVGKALNETRFIISQSNEEYIQRELFDELLTVLHRHEGVRTNDIEMVLGTIIDNPSQSISYFKENRNKLREMIDFVEDHSGLSHHAGSLKVLLEKIESTDEPYNPYGQPPEEPTNDIENQEIKNE
ncbi:MAG TPA: hypothetical protein VJB34_08325 [Bdellovibrionota bacterium]|nr:hypothetical protein [Bdellovibrionota bacterium]